MKTLTAISIATFLAIVVVGSIVFGFSGIRAKIEKSDAVDEVMQQCKKEKGQLYAQIGELQERMKAIQTLASQLKSDSQKMMCDAGEQLKLAGAMKARFTNFIALEETNHALGLQIAKMQETITRQADLLRSHHVLNLNSNAPGPVFRR